MLLILGGTSHAGRFDAPAAYQATAVAQQHNLEHHARIICTRAALVVAEAFIQRTQIEFVVDQVIERELEGSGLDLFAQHHRQKPGIAVDHLVSRHVLRPLQ